MYGHLCLINADGTNLVDSGVLATYPEWSPDGNKIVFSNWALPGGGYNSDLFVWIFLGFFAMVIVGQLIPAVMLIIGLVKAKREWK